MRATASVGRHALALGVEYEDSRLTIDSRSPDIGTIEHPADSLFTVVWQGFEGTWHNRLPTAYVQDSWRVADRLTINAGLRWSRQFLSGADGSTAQRSPDEWQPRLGFVWQLGQPGTQRILGSYGRFYQQWPLNFSSVWYADVTYTEKAYAADPRQPDAPLIYSFDGSTRAEDFAGQLDGFEVENFDEFTLGYERLLGSATRLVIRGVRRELRSSVQFGADPNSQAYWVLGTPGEGDFDFLPSPKREYTALELSIDGAWRAFHYRASYVLSRSWGNYSGLYSSDIGLGNPGGNFSFFLPDQAENSTGFLPNDRPHVLKLVGNYRTESGLMVGAFFTWQSGTPINEFGPGPIPFETLTPVFRSQRGSAGRTPSIWDLNLRLAYDLPVTFRGARVLLDLLHLGNPQQTVLVDQYRFRVSDVENADYLRPVAFQPPMTARLGFEVRF